MLKEKFKVESSACRQFKNSEDMALPNTQDMLRQATLRLGGQSGEVVEVEDIKYYLGARLLSHLESGDRVSKDYQLLQQAQDFSSPTGVQAAIEVFKAQSGFLREELSTTPKDKRDRNLIREGLALGLSIVKLEKEMLPEAQKATVSGQLPKDNEEEKVNAALDVWRQPVGHNITQEELHFLLDATPTLFPNITQEGLQLISTAKDFAKSKEGRDAAVLVIQVERNAIVANVLKERPKDWDETMLRAENVVVGVAELMEELEKGNKRS